MGDILEQEIKYLKGVGPKRADLFQSELGIATCRDLLYYFAFKYIDRSKFYKISEIDTTQAFIQVRGKITGFRNRLIHAYDSMDQSIIWAIIKNHLVPLKKEIVEKI
jgi:RecG-like helicase